MIYKKMIDDVTENLTLLEALEKDYSILDYLTLANPLWDAKLLKRFKGMYGSRQIATNNLEEFKLWIKLINDEYSNLYQDKLSIYEMQLNGDDGVKISRTTAKTNTAQTATTNDLTSATNDSINTTNYDLARTSNPVEKPTTKQSVSEAIQNTQNSTINSSGNGSESIAETITGDVNVIEQREKWIKFIRDLILDYCKEFKDCFALVYA